jgi:hypothetical protein
MPIHGRFVYLTGSSDWHHEAMKLYLDGLYPCPDTVNEVLAPLQGTTKRVLDIGMCLHLTTKNEANGIWKAVG